MCVAEESYGVSGRRKAPPAFPSSPTADICCPTFPSPTAAVLAEMKRECCPPVTRTFNTVMIACNASGQWQVSWLLD